MYIVWYIHGCLYYYLIWHGTCGRDDAARETNYYIGSWTVACLISQVVSRLKIDMLLYWLQYNIVYSRLGE